MDPKHLAIPVVICLQFIVLISMNCTGDQQPSQSHPRTIEMISDTTLHYWQPAAFNMGQFAVTDSQVSITATEKGLAGTKWTGGHPVSNYRFSCRAMRTSGNDFFAGITFPVKSSWCTLIVGGWGGRVVGLSNVDWSPAVENITTRQKSFKNNQWYLLEIEVTDPLITVRIDGKPMFELDPAAHSLSLYTLMKNEKSINISTYKTGAIIRDLTITTLEQTR